NAERIIGLHDRMTSIKSKYNDLLNDLDSQIQNIVEAFNEKHSEELEQLQASHSEAAEELKGMISSQVDEMERYIQARSASWHDSESSLNYLYWSELWQEFLDFLERAEYQEFDIEIKLEALEAEELPPFNPNIN
ncbi:hypothetical protein V9K25_004150, partial [Vibrio navarrensis]